MRKTLIFCSLMLVCCSLVFAKGETRGTNPTHQTKADVAAMQATKDLAKVGVVTENPREGGNLDEGGETCGAAVNIASLPYVDSGNTCDNVDNDNSVCPYSLTGGKDVFYKYTPATNTQVFITLCNDGTAYDSKLYVREGSCSGIVVACNDDWCSTSHSDYVSELPVICMLGGVTYYIAVDAYSSSDCGQYELHVDNVGSCEIEPPVECDCSGEVCNDTGGDILDPSEDEETGDIIYNTLYTTVFVGQEYHITDLNVCLGLNHTYISDMEITLTSPNGTTVILWSNQCGGNDDIPCAHFDDEASGFLSCPPAVAEVGWPWGFLSDFDGENAYGVWTLAITDYYFADTGHLNFWCLDFDYDGILPVSFGSLSALAGDNAIQLNWNTLAESSNDRFEIVRDGAVVGQVEATNSATGSNYSWVDNAAHNGTTYNYTLVSVSIRGDRAELATIQATPNFSNGAVTEYALMQNYPNPFNPETNISFDLVDGGMVTLNVYNMLGQQVATLVNGSMEAGRHIVSFNATNLPSGLYMYRLEAGSFSAQMKMVLMK